MPRAAAKAPPRKRFGQHFLRDPGVLAQLMDRLALRRDDQVLEIGPGRGALTRHIYGVVRRCAAIEIDRDLAAALCSEFPGLEIINADVLAYDFGKLRNANPWRIVGNLPYNISSPLLFKLMDLANDFGDAPFIQDMHFMLQREMAARLAAKPGGKHWGRLAVAAQFRCTVEALFDVAPQSFAPPPKVFSTLVRLLPHPQGCRAPPQLDAVLRMAFSARRKRLGNALKELRLDWDAIGVDAALRAEQLAAADFVKIAEAVQGGHRGHLRNR